MTVRLGLRLAVAGGQPALLRLGVTAVGVGVAVTLLLLSLTSQSAVQGRAERVGWRSATRDTAASAPDATLFLSVSDYHEGRTISRNYVAALGPRAPVPPGLDRLPGPGEVAVSPALRRLLAATPDDQLDDRYPGRIVATIGGAGLAHPDELAAVIGRTPKQLGEVRSREVRAVRGFDTLPGGYAYAVVLRALLLAGSTLLLVPVVIFAVMATRVAAAQREQRLAALRLAGATRRQTATVAAVETGLGAAAGALLGLVGYEVGRRILAATLTFQGGRWFAEDVVVAPWVLALVLVGVPLLAMLTTVASLGRVQAGPLATSRPGPRPRLSAWRVLPFAVGVGGQLVAAPLRSVLGDDALDRLTPMFVLATIFGFVAIGPWLCLFAGRGLARVARGVPGLIAARRVASDPRGTFRAVSGVVLAAFAVTYGASLVDITSAEPAPDDHGQGTLRPGVVEILTAGVDPPEIAPLLTEGAVAVQYRPGGPGDERAASCAALAPLTTEPCPGPDSGEQWGLLTGPEDAATATDTVFRLYVPTQGGAAAERVRTRAAALIPNALIHLQEDRVRRELVGGRSLVQLMRIGWMFVLVVAACSLTVGTLAAMIERRRPFALLRASGLRLAELRRVVFLETAAAMLITSLVGVGLGLTSSYALAVFRDLPWTWPDAGTFATVAAGVLAALALTTVALPLVDAATRHDSVRYE
jgi:hypothetical protein